jgi:hypothetical protein
MSFLTPRRAATVLLIFMLATFMALGAMICTVAHGVH